MIPQVRSARSSIELGSVVLRWLPTLALLGLVLLAAPLWRWSRGWGWTPAGMVLVGVGTVVLFTLATVPD